MGRIDLTALAAAAALSLSSEAGAWREPTEPGAMVAASRTEEGPRRVRARGRRPTPFVRVTLADGVTLADLARTYGVPVARIVAFNGIRNPRALHAGRRLAIPGATAVKVLRARPTCRNPAVEFLRVANDERADVVLTRCNGRADPGGVARLSRLARSLRSTSSLELDPRLLEKLQRVAVRFPGKRLEVISGYRPHPRAREGISNHTKGRAIDFRVSGVPNETLRDFLRTLDDAGVGYYPNSVFVHLDVREGRAFWVDYSRPGEAPRYGRLQPDAPTRHYPRGLRPRTPSSSLRRSESFWHPVELRSPGDPALRSP